MKLERGEYIVMLQDVDGFEICSGSVFDNKDDAIRHAEKAIKDKELLDAGLHKVMLRNYQGKEIFLERSW